ncbi:MAG TPA: ferritin-like domain-containing protein [Nitrolancea sp.]|jgi:hypothetical protein|nr:ferritin-like domain-containing protein [Nitrolancea sp.]
MADQCESLPDIINIAATAEALAIAALGGALQSVTAGNLALNAEQVQFVTAARAEEQAHLDYLTAAGAKPLTTTFTLPDPKILSDVPTFLNTVIGLEEAFIAAYLAATQEFAILGRTDLVQIAVRAGCVEAEHRAHARFFAIVAGVLTGVPNNVAFEKAMFTSIGAAATALTQLGWIGGTGPQFSYPSAPAIDYTGVTELKL